MIQEQYRIKVVVLLTCFNRKEKTKKSILTLSEGNPRCNFTFIVVDDGSTDGTDKMLQDLTGYADITVIRGDGNLFYTGGMHKAMEYVKNNEIDDYDYYLLINDDVDFFPNCIENLIEQSDEQHHAVVVGATRDDAGKTSYGAVIHTKNVQHRTLDVSEWRVNADMFNGNCVLIPKEIFLKTDAMDDHYTHAMGDFDYGFEIKRNGGEIHSSKDYVGICNRNDMKGHWSDKNLPRLERIKQKESLKGLPCKQWFYYLKKNYGLGYALFYSAVPYINILIGR